MAETFRITYQQKFRCERAKDCRRQLINDALEGNPELFKFLYEDKNKPLQKLYKRRYELKWLESHLLECREILMNVDKSIATKRELLRIFLQWYHKFVEAWGYNSADAFFSMLKLSRLIF